MARPTKYTDELAEKICERIATSSDSLHVICPELNIGISTVMDWLGDEKHRKFSEQYARAKELQADFLTTQIIQMADDKSGDLLDGEFGQQGNSAAIGRSKLQVDARKWLAGKLAPKKYGDKVEHSGNVDIAITGMTIK